MPGIILKVSRSTLRTDAIITDALLGQADALDCFNKLQQEAKSIKVQLENNKLEAETDKIKFEREKTEQLLKLIEQMPKEYQSEAIKAAFSNCCDHNDIVINNQEDNN